MKVLFNTSFGLRLDTEQVVQEIIRFMLADDKRRYKVIIGTDSERVNDNGADFVTAIVVHRVGNGGRYFWRRLENGKFFNLRDRILQEVLFSLEVAHNFLGVFKNFQAPNFDFEIHADIGANGATNSMIQEVVGMIRAHNFEAKTKPDSYAATKVADRHV